MSWTFLWIMRTHQIMLIHNQQLAYAMPIYSHWGADCSCLSTFICDQKLTSEFFKEGILTYVSLSANIELMNNSNMLTNLLHWLTNLLPKCTKCDDVGLVACIAQRNLLKRLYNSVVDHSHVDRPRTTISQISRKELALPLTLPALLKGQRTTFQ